MPEQTNLVYRWLHMPSGQVGLVLICRDLPPDVVMFVPWHAVVWPEKEQLLSAKLMPANQFRRIIMTSEAPTGFSTPRKIQP